MTIQDEYEPRCSTVVSISFFDEDAAARDAATVNMICCLRKTKKEV